MVEDRLQVDLQEMDLLGVGRKVEEPSELLGVIPLLVVLSEADQIQEQGT